MGGLQVAVKVNHRDRPIGLVDAPQQRKCDGMVSSQSDHSRQSLARLGKTGFIRIGVWLAHEDAVVSLFDLLDCIRIVVAIPSVRRLHCT